MAVLPVAAPARPTAEPNVTPLIDVLLVLLIIFMLLLRVRHTLPAQVPPAEPGAVPGPSPRHQIVLELLADGGYAVNGQPVPVAELDGYLRAVYTDRAAKLLFVQAAPERAYQEVIAAMDLARGAGVQVLGLMPQPGSH